VDDGYGFGGVGEGVEGELGGVEAIAVEAEGVGFADEMAKDLEDAESSVYAGLESAGVWPSSASKLGQAKKV
jgi:hypothetical protein